MTDHPSSQSTRPNQVGTVLIHGVPIVSLVIDGQERLCLAQISNTLLKSFSYNEIHNRRVALGITCVQCTPLQLELLRRAGAMPVSSRRCGMITKREAERLVKSFLGEHAPPKLPEDFYFDVEHNCAWGCRGSFTPSRYNSSRAKCIKCAHCGVFFSPNKFIFHSHRLPDSQYVQPDAANFNSWRRHLKLHNEDNDDIMHAWEDVKAMFNGGGRKRVPSHGKEPEKRTDPPPPTRKEEPNGNPAARLFDPAGFPSISFGPPKMAAPFPGPFHPAFPLMFCDQMRTPAPFMPPSHIWDAWLQQQAHLKSQAELTNLWQNSRHSRHESKESDDTDEQTLDDSQPMPTPKTRSHNIDTILGINHQPTGQQANSTSAFKPLQRKADSGDDEPPSKAAKEANSASDIVSYLGQKRKLAGREGGQCGRR